MTPLRRLDLTNFKAFQRFTVAFRGDAFLVGPNNAGKSTLIAALRAAAAMLRLAKRLSATARIDLGPSQPLGHWFTSDQLGLVDENLRHEFQQTETILRLRLGGEAYMEARWPVDEEGGYFFVRHRDINLRTPREVRPAFPTTGVVPVLSPLEHRETVLSPDHVRANLDTRLASRHFRNQLRTLRLEDSSTHANRLDEFLEFAQPWVAELDFDELRVQVGAGSSVDFYYREAGSRIPKEIFWAGDGLQIWLQILLHVFRLWDTDVIILDEPEIFLHSDLQRRLVALLESVPGQTITATHSPEVLAEASQDAVLWVSRDRRQAVRSPDPSVLFELADTLGSHFNIRLARALRARCVLFVEGDDLKLLRHLAVTLGARNVVRETGLAVIPLVGFDRWEHVEPFQWLLKEMLQDAVSAHVVLDRDYRADDTVADIESRLRGVGAQPHVWRRHELENYLVHPAAIARLSSAPEDWVERTIAEAVEEFEDEVYARIDAERIARLRPTGVDDATISLEAKRRADEIWADPTQRFHIAPGKELLRKLNGRLQHANYGTLSSRKLAAELRDHEIPAQVRSVLLRVNSDAEAHPR